MSMNEIHPFLIFCSFVVAKKETKSVARHLRLQIVQKFRQNALGQLSHAREVSKTKRAPELTKTDLRMRAQTFNFVTKNKISSKNTLTQKCCSIVKNGLTPAKFFVWIEETNRD